MRDSIIDAGMLLLFSGSCLLRFAVLCLGILLVIGAIAFVFPFVADLAGLPNLTLYDAIADIVDNVAYTLGWW